ncbi:cystin-1 isoform X2 [Cynocephalus volans]|uniref:cystin-1 isoform X2 n=1 Tax=Cynocephalus volans TaxID=110931 RepID=UPI002FC72749
MGSGSSRSGRSGRALRRRRSSDSRPAEPGGAAPQVGTRPRLSATAAEEATGHDPGPAAPPDGGDETLRLLDQLLAESAAWDPGEPAPRRPARPRPAAGAGSAVSLAFFLWLWKHLPEVKAFTDGDGPRTGSLTTRGYFSRASFGTSPCHFSNAKQLSHAESTCTA